MGGGERRVRREGWGMRDGRRREEDERGGVGDEG